MTTYWQEKFVGKLGTWALHIHSMALTLLKWTNGLWLRNLAGWLAGASGHDCIVLTKENFAFFVVWFTLPYWQGWKLAFWTKLDACVLRCGHKIMQRKACRKVEQDDGTIEYKAQPSSAVFAFLRLLPCKDELFIRRVRWYQSMARSPSLHSIWFACMFGIFSFEPHPVVEGIGSISSHAHPWAQQFHNDVCRWAEIEGGDTLVWLSAGQPLRLFTDLRDDFLRLDVRCFRRIPFGVAVPPPEFQPSPDPLPQGLLIQEEENAETDDQFSCTCLKAHRWRTMWREIQHRTRLGSAHL